MAGDESGEDIGQIAARSGPRSKRSKIPSARPVTKRPISADEIVIIAVPLVQPISRAFAIDPLRLAVIFPVNLQLGYLVPPLGMNLFLASYRPC